MIRSKYLSLVVWVLAAGAFLFTLILMFNPSWLGISPASVSSEYATALFDKNQVMEIDIQMNTEDWQTLLQNAAEEEYYPCDLVINGETYSSVGIRAKGNSSLSQVAHSDSDRYSFKFEFDQYIVGQNCMGLDKFVVNNMQGDATYMKEYLSYELLTYMGVPCPLFSFAHMTVNGEEWGLYLAVEALEESFAERQYGLNHGMLYKPENFGMPERNGMQRPAGAQPPMPFPGDIESVPMLPNGIIPETALSEEGFNPSENGLNDFQVLEMNETPESLTNMPADMPEVFSQPAIPESENNRPPGNGGRRGFGGRSSGGTDLVYVDDNPESYSAVFESAVFQADEADFQRIVTALKHLNEGTELEKYVDVDEMLRYIAANAVVVNLDSYFGTMTHNYYLYEKEGQIAMLPWDYNLAFGGFQGSASSAVNLPIDTPVSGVTLQERPLIGQLLAVEEYKERYHTYLQQLMDDYFSNGYFPERIDELNGLIAPYVQKDATAFYSYEEYQAALPVLKLFGELRAQSILGQLAGTIPSTTDEQKQHPERLVDASGLDIQLMGSHGGGGNSAIRRGQNRDTEQAGDWSIASAAADMTASAPEEMRQLPLDATETTPEAAAGFPDERNPRNDFMRGTSAGNQPFSGGSTVLSEIPLMIYLICFLGIIVGMMCAALYKRK